MSSEIDRRTSANGRINALKYLSGFGHPKNPSSPFGSSAKKLKAGQTSNVQLMIKADFGLNAIATIRRIAASPTKFIAAQYSRFPARVSPEMYFIQRDAAS
jgi:hypothetical protein